MSFSYNFKSKKTAFWVWRFPLGKSGSTAAMSAYYYQNWPWEPYCLLTRNVTMSVKVSLETKYWCSGNKGHEVNQCKHIHFLSKESIFD